MEVQLNPVHVQSNSSDMSGHSAFQLHLTAPWTHVPSAHLWPHLVVTSSDLLVETQAPSSPPFLQSVKLATTLTLKRVSPGRPWTSRSRGPLASQVPALEADGEQLESSQDQERLKVVGPVRGQEVVKETSRDPDSVAVTFGET